MKNILLKLINYLRIRKRLLFRAFTKGKESFLHLFSFSQYKNIKNYKNVTKDKRLFVVATGPSLRIEDLEKLIDEDTFSCNSIIYSFDNTDWRPSYYAICDTNVYYKLKKEIEEVQLANVFYPNSRMNFSKDSFQKFYLSENLCRTINERKIIPNRFQKRKFSLDCEKVIFEGASVVYVIMQLAIYMGYKEIYLLGCDCNFSSQIKHASFTQYNMKQMNSYSEIEKGILQDYQAIKIASEKSGVKIFNATRGGNLEIFPRVDFDSIFHND